MWLEDMEVLTQPLSDGYRIRLGRYLATTNDAHLRALGNRVTETADRPHERAEVDLALQRWCSELLSQKPGGPR